MPYQVVLIFGQIPHCMGLNSSQMPGSAWRKERMGSFGIDWDIIPVNRFVACGAHGSCMDLSGLKFQVPPYIFLYDNYV